MGLSDAEVLDPVAIQIMRHEYASWIAGNGLADGTEVISALLNNLVAQVPHILGFSGEFRKFERLGLELKLDATTNILLKSEYYVVVKSLNRARNCLVHRHGIVGVADCEGTGKLSLAWIGPVLRVRQGANWQEVGPLHRGGFNRGDHGMVLLQVKNIDRYFPLGEKLILPPHDLSSLFWCLQGILVQLHVILNGLLGFDPIDQYRDIDVSAA